MGLRAYQMAHLSLDSCRPFEPSYCRALVITPLHAAGRAHKYLETENLDNTNLNCA